MNTTVYAENSFELQAANNKLLDYSQLQVKNYTEEASEIADTLVVAKNHGLKTKTISTRLNRVRNLAKYWHKISEAIKRGYSIVPSAYWEEVIAVRVKENSTPRKTQIEDQNLAAGEGKYVDPRPFTRTHRWTDGDGKNHLETYAVSHDDEIEFPLIACNTKLLNAGKQAMDYLVFDRIAYAGKKRDPLLLGQIRDPKSNDYINFVIAWWLNVEDL